MAADVSTFFEAWQADRQKMKALAPALTGAFSTFHQAIMKEGVLSVREKELIALGIGLADRCTPCINLHVQWCSRREPLASRSWRRRAWPF